MSHSNKLPIYPKPTAKLLLSEEGSAGSPAAFELDKKGIQVTIFEQSERLGGKIWSYEGKRIDREAIEQELQNINKLDIIVNYHQRNRPGETGPADQRV